MASFIRRFNKMQTLSKLVVLTTLALLATGCVLAVAGSPLAPFALVAAFAPLPTGLVYERATR